MHKQTTAKHPRYCLCIGCCCCCWDNEYTFVALILSELYAIGISCLYIYITHIYAHHPANSWGAKTHSANWTRIYRKYIRLMRWMRYRTNTYIYIHFFNLRRGRKFNPCIFSRRFSPNPIPTQAQRKQPKTEVCVCLQYILMAIRQQRIGLLYIYIYLSPIFERHTHTHIFLPGKGYSSDD